MDFAVPAGHRVKFKETGKKNKYLDQARELKKAVKHEGDGNVTYSYADACRNIFNTIRTSGTQFFRKIYLSLYSKGFERVTKGIMCER